MSGWIDWSWFGFVWEVWEKGASSICWIFSPLSSIGSNKIDQWISHFEVTSPPDFRTTGILVAKRTNCFVFIAPKPASNYAIANLNAPKCVRNYKIKTFIRIFQTLFSRSQSETGNGQESGAKRKCSGWKMKSSHVHCGKCGQSHLGRKSSLCNNNAIFYLFETLHLMH